VDRNRLDADPDPDLNFHVDFDPDPDPDWHQNNTVTDPHADPSPSFTHITQHCHFTLFNHSHQCQMYDSFPKFWIAYLNFFYSLFK
jgi:hypothetical protein